jgi:RimJ/RimL family protein N-acetyltransferase
MSEVLKYIISYLINETDFEVIAGRHDVDNPASGKVMVKNGFVFETNKTEHSKKNNSLIVVSCYRLDLRK